MNVGLSTEKRAENLVKLRLHYWLMFMSRDLVHCVTLFRKQAFVDTLCELTCVNFLRVLLEHSFMDTFWA